MAKGDADNGDQSIGDAAAILDEIRSHPEVLKATVTRGLSERWLRIAAVIRVPMARRFVAEGRTPEGVKPQEEIWFDFWGAPVGSRAPEVSLRPDFPDHLAHVQPWRTHQGRLLPCFLNGEADELLHGRGLGALIDQVIFWLDDAASGRLIDPAHGWEPTRRDGLPNYLIADEEWMRGLVTPKGGVHLSSLRVLGIADQEEEHFRATAGSDRQPFTSKAYDELYRREEGRFFRSSGLCLTIWSPDRPAALACVYTPEWVQTLGDVRARANEFGCRAELESALERLDRARRSFTPIYEDQIDPRIKLVIVLIARRPFPLIGSQSSLEIMPYAIDIQYPALTPLGDVTSARPLGHRSVVSRRLLRRLSGEDDAMKSPAWTLLGAGSLGSKIALHMTRGGEGPKAVIDKRPLSPHHMARHGLLPAHEEPTAFFEGAKAVELARAVRSLAQPCEAHEQDIRSLLSATERPWAKTDAALVNTAASIAVRNALCSVGVDPTLPRIIEAALFAEGRLGVLAVEGPRRDPTLTDLFEALRIAAHWNEDLEALLIDGDDGLDRITIGQGCGSVTMALSDARLSMMAAAMAEELKSILRQPREAQESRLILYRLGVDGISLQRQIVDIEPVIRLEIPELPGWRVHLHGRVRTLIDQEVARHAAVETGGILIGRSCGFTRQHHVIDVLPAPPDSVREAGRFLLGEEGRAKAIDNALLQYGAPYMALGTWHSHLQDSPPSPTDRETAAVIAKASGASPLCLVRTPSRWTAFSSSQAWGQPREGAA